MQRNGTIPTEKYSAQFSDTYIVSGVRFAGTYSIPGVFATPVNGIPGEIVIEVAKGVETEFVDPIFERRIIDVFPGGTQVALVAKVAALFERLERLVASGAMTAEQFEALRREVKETYEKTTATANLLLDLFQSVGELAIEPAHRIVVSK
jgi:hypothetical protein